MAMVPFKKKNKAKGMEPKRDPMPNKVSGAPKRNRDGGVRRDPFSQTVTDTPPKMPRRV